MPLLRNRHLLRALPVAGAFVALLLPTSAQALASAPIHTSTALTFPVPASARVHPTTTSPSPATTAPAKATVPPTASTPTTTYVPAGTPPTSTIPSVPGAATSSPATTVSVSPAGTPAARYLGQPRRAASGATKLSPAAIVAAVLAVLLILFCTVWGLARWRAYEPHWTLSLRHTLAEAGLHVSATWEELADWARLGR